MLGVTIGKARAEELREALAALNLVDKSRLIEESAAEITIPLVSAPSTALLDEFGASLVDLDFAVRKAFVDPIDEIRRLAEIPQHLRQTLPSKWERYGDIIVLRLEPELERYETEIAQAYASVLHLKTVLREMGPIQGPYRSPSVRTLLGSDTVATHIENHIIYEFDASEIMFSSGNQEERLRMASLACDREVIVDMFAGIGYFSLPIAVYQKPSRIIACEINPRAHFFLKKNIAANKVDRVVDPVLGDNRDLPGKDFADRVIMGYVKTTDEFLPAAIRMLRDGGIIHYHETCPNELLDIRPLARVRKASGGDIELLRSKAVKSYAPGVTHVVLDVRVFKSS